MRMTRFDYICIAILVLFSIFAMLVRLGDHCLWQDEAETALISKSVLKYGIPKATDGLNSFSQLHGHELGPGGVSLSQTWLPYYLIAGFFALFGASTFVARLPFALLGVGTVVLIYFLGRSLWNSRRAGMLSALLLLSSVPFLILVRQCRYYSAEMFGCLLVFLAYFRMLEGRKRGFALFTVASVLLFHTHYMHCGITLVALATHALIFQRGKLKWVLLTSVITGVLCLPWIIGVAGINDACAREMGYIPFDLDRVPQLISMLSSLIFQFIVPAPLLLLPFAIAYKWRERRKQLIPANDTLSKAAALGLFIVFNILILSLLSPDDQFRRIDVLIPAFCLILALMLEMSARIHWGLMLIGLLLYANAQPLRHFAHELTHHYRGPVDGIVDYLNHHARPTDTVAITYEDMPVKFYTRLRVFGGLSQENLEDAAKADWIVIRKYSVCTQDRDFKDYLLHNVDWSHYKFIRIDYPDTPFENREDPRLHYYGTVENEDRVLISRRTH